MIKRTFKQELKWHDDEKFDETTTCEWHLFGLIPLRKRSIKVRHILGEGKSKLGFNK